MRSARTLLVCTVAALGVFSGDFLTAGAGAMQAAQSSREADGARFLKGAVETHFHLEAGRADINTVRRARERGVRALVLKHHNEPSATMAWVLREEIPNILIFGGIVMNRPNGG